MLHEQIRYVLLKGFAAKPPLFTTPEHTAQLQTSTDTLYQLKQTFLPVFPSTLALLLDLDLSPLMCLRPSIGHWYSGPISTSTTMNRSQWYVPVAHTS